MGGYPIGKKGLNHQADSPEFLVITDAVRKCDTFAHTVLPLATQAAVELEASNIVC